MKRLPTGIIVFDAIDIICISFSAGSITAYVFKKYREYRNDKQIKIRGEDPIVTELKRESPIIMISENGTPLRLPLVRCGEQIRGYSLMIKNKKLAQILMAIVNARKNQQKLRLLQEVFFHLNGLLTAATGLRFALGGSLSYVQILLIAFPSTIGGYLMGLTYAYPLASAVLPIAILFGRGIEEIPDPYEKCRIICRAAEKYHNKQLGIEMKQLDSLIEEASAALKLPLDKKPLLCVEEKLSLLQRFKLKQLIDSKKARRRVVHFNEFIKKFPECDVAPESVYQEVFGEMAEKIKVKIDSTI